MPARAHVQVLRQFARAACPTTVPSRTSSLAGFDQLISSERLPDASTWSAMSLPFHIHPMGLSIDDLDDEGPFGGVYKSCLWHDEAAISGRQRESSLRLPCRAVAPYRCDDVHFYAFGAQPVVQSTRQAVYLGRESLIGKGLYLESRCAHFG